MPVDKQVAQRHKILDRLFRSVEGYTYSELIAELEESDIYVSDRTLKADKKYFEDNYGAVFCEGMKRGKQALIRYEDIDSSVFASMLSEEEKGVIGKLLERLQFHNDIPQYQWMSFLLDGLKSKDGDYDFGDYIEFENNIDLTGLENFKALMEACMERQVISFTYIPFKHANTPRSFVVSPYLLKQYNNRWFLICKDTRYDSLSTYALDRIQAESIRRSPEVEFEEPDRNYIGRCLASTIGVTSAFDEEKREDVLLSVDKDRYKYIETKPILPWQELVEENPNQERQILRLEGITINKELVSLLLSYGPDIEVLEPDSLRQEIIQSLNSSSELYKG